MLCIYAIPQATLKVTVCFLYALTVTKRGKDTNRQIKTQEKE